MTDFGAPSATQMSLTRTQMSKLAMEREKKIHSVAKLPMCASPFQILWRTFWGDLRHTAKTSRKLLHFTNCKNALPFGRPTCLGSRQSLHCCLDGGCCFSPWSQNAAEHLFQWIFKPEGEKQVIQTRSHTHPDLLMDKLSVVFLTPQHHNPAKVYITWHTFMRLIPLWLSNSLYQFTQMHWNTIISQLDFPSQINIHPQTHGT